MTISFFIVNLAVNAVNYYLIAMIMTGDIAGTRRRHAPAVRIIAVRYYAESVDKKTLSPDGKSVFS